MTRGKKPEADQQAAKAAAPKPKPKPKPAPTLTAPILGGDELPEREPELEPVDPEVVSRLATFLAQSQGVRRPNDIQLRVSIPVSYQMLAEMIIVGSLYTKVMGERHGDE